jgi:hypothetical protein
MWSKVHRSCVCSFPSLSGKHASTLLILTDTWCQTPGQSWCPGCEKYQPASQTRLVKCVKNRVSCISRRVFGDCPLKSFLVAFSGDFMRWWMSTGCIWPYAIAKCSSASWNLSRLSYDYNSMIYLHPQKAHFVEVMEFQGLRRRKFQASTPIAQARCVKYYFQLKCCMTDKVLWLVSSRYELSCAHGYGLICKEKIKSRRVPSGFPSRQGVWG